MTVNTKKAVPKDLIDSLLAFVFVGLDACLSSAVAVVIESLNLKAHAALPSRHTLPSPATNPPKQIVLRDGALTVYRRSQRYQCRFRLASDAWHRQATGASSIETATLCP